MITDQCRAGHAIRTRGPKLAETAAVEQYRVQPDLEGRYGARGRAYCVRDLAFHVDSLATSVELADERPFIRYVTWARRTMAAHGIPVGDFLVSLRALRHAAGIHLPPTAAEAAQRHIDAAIAAHSWPPDQRCGNASNRGGFTLLETLITIGILAALIGFLFPVLSSARASARRVECASHLRQLVTACTSYLAEYRELPQLTYMPAGGCAKPNAMDVDFLNRLGPFMSWRTVKPTDREPDLPEAVRCPFRDDADRLLDPETSLGTPYWTTGYVYTARLDEPARSSGRVLRADASADAHGRYRRVLWADQVVCVQQDGRPIGQSFFHAHSAYILVPGTANVTSAKPFAGWHRAWTDGSVEWRSGTELNLEDAPAVRNAAGYQTQVPQGQALYLF